MDSGTAGLIGYENAYAAGDHVHPSDTTRQDSSVYTTYTPVGGVSGTDFAFNVSGWTLSNGDTFKLALHTAILVANPRIWFNGSSTQINNIYMKTTMGSDLYSNTSINYSLKPGRVVPMTYGVSTNINIWGWYTTEALICALNTVVGTLAVGFGGTGNTSFTNGYVLVGNGTGALVAVDPNILAPAPVYYNFSADIATQVSGNVNPITTFDTPNSGVINQVFMDGLKLTLNKDYTITPSTTPGNIILTLINRKYGSKFPTRYTFVRI